MDAENKKPFDVENDPIVVIHGGVTLTTPRPFEHFRGTVAVHYLLLEGDGEPRETKQAHVIMEMVIGRVDDIAADYREKLLRAAKALAATPYARDLPAQRAVLARMGLVPGRGSVTVPERCTYLPEAPTGADRDAARNALWLDAIVMSARKGGTERIGGLVAELRRHDFDRNYAHLSEGGVTRVSLMDCLKRYAVLNDHREARVLRLTPGQLQQVKDWSPDESGDETGTWKDRVGFGKELAGLVLVEGDFGPYPE